MFSFNSQKLLAIRQMLKGKFNVPSEEGARLAFKLPSGSRMRFCFSFDVPLKVMMFHFKLAYTLYLESI